MKFHSYYIGFSLCLFLALMCSCTKEYIYGDPDSWHTSGNTQENSIDKVALSFVASVNPHQPFNATRATTNTIPLPKGCYAQIYIYESGDYPGDGQWLYSFLCRAQEDGMLTPVNGVIELATGLYNFYATSSLDSISDQGPDFSKYTGLANGLSNNVDYLWWKDENMYISKNEEAIPIEFERCCAKLTFLLTADTGDTLDEVTQFNITTGDPNKCYFSLRSGNISTTTSLTTSKQACTIVDTTASIIILPLNTNINLSALIEATVNGTSGWYTESIPLWFTDNYRAGYDYVYEIEFK